MRGAAAGVRLAALAAAAGCGLLLAACGDPVVVLGDQPGIMRVVAGDAPDLRPDERTPATQVLLNGPRGVAVDDGGVVYVADQRAARILAVTSSGALRVVVDHQGCTGAACLQRPYGLDADAEGGLLVADPLAGRVLRVDRASGSASVVAGDPSGGEATPGAQAVSVRLREPTGVAAAPDGRVYFSERPAQRIWRVERDGSLSLVAGSGMVGDQGDNGPAAQARLRVPGGLALAGDVLYVADTGNHRIRAVDLQTGTIRAVAGTGGLGSSGDGGPALGATFRSPDAVAVTEDGRTLFVSDTGNRRVRRVRLASGVVQAFAGTGEEPYAGTGLEAAATAIAAPSGLAVFAGSFLFVADNAHGLVWRTTVGF